MDEEENKNQDIGWTHLIVGGLLTIALVFGAVTVTTRGQWFGLGMSKSSTTGAGTR